MILATLMTAMSISARAVVRDSSRAETCRTETRGATLGQASSIPSTVCLRPCQDGIIVAVDDQHDVESYYSGPLVNYAPLPNGTTTFNSNSFTYTLLNQIGLSGAAIPGLGWSPGWGRLVPGL